MIYIIPFVFSILWQLIIYNRSLGINAILFMIPFLISMYFFLKKEGLIVRKQGLLWMIPILILSFTYFIYDNAFFQVFHKIVITLLFFVLYIEIQDKISSLISLFYQICYFILKPFYYLDQFSMKLCEMISNQFSLKDKNLKVLKSTLIIFPLILFVLILLISADFVFGSFFTGILESIRVSCQSIDRLIFTIFFFLYLGGLLYYFSNFYLKEKKIKSSSKKYDIFTFQLLFTILNIIYFFFDIIQIRSLFLHQITMDISYAEYARSGFFQLMVISVLNITLLLFSTKTIKNTYHTIMRVLLISFTTIIIASAFFRMMMYEHAYGYTLLRLLVYVILITDFILLIPTLFYILRPNFNILRVYIIIVTIVYTLLSLFPVDSFIATNNIKRYEKTKKIDLYYLENHHADNVPILMELYLKTDNMEIRHHLKYYFENFKMYSDVISYNLSRKIANQLIHKNIK